MIVVLGSINVDIVLDVERLPVRGETVLCSGYTLLPGGKGANQAAAASRAGSGPVFMVGCVGEDTYADPALAALADNGVDVSGVTVVDRPTGLAVVMVEASSENQIVAASGANTAVSAEQVPADRLGPQSILVLQMEIPVPEVERAIARARQAESRVILNLAPAQAIGDAALSDCDILVLNQGEARSLANGGTPQDLACQLARRFSLDCIVTLGAAGAVLATSGPCYRVAALDIEPVDSVGAGDAFVGALAAALDSGAAITEAVRRASVAGGLACLRSGARSALPRAADIDAALPGLAPSVIVTA